MKQFNSWPLLAVVAVLILALSPMAIAAPEPAVVETTPVMASAVAAAGSGKTFIDWLVVKHITVQGGGIDMSSNLDMQTYIISNIGNAATDFDTNGGLTLAGELTTNGGTDLNSYVLELDADGDTEVQAATDDVVLMTSGAATGTWEIRTGNLEVGDGAATTTPNGEDAYIEGFLEVDGIVYLDGALDADSTADFASTVDVNGTLTANACTVTGTAQAADLEATDDLFVADDAWITGSLDVDGAVTLNSTFDVDGTSDLKGNVSDSGGAFTIADNALIDGIADAVQLTVQGYTTQTSDLFVAETSAGTDMFKVTNAGIGTLTGLANLNGGIAVDSSAFIVADGTGNMTVGGTSDLKGNVSDSGGALTFADNTIVDGAADAIQLTVQGFTTQTSNLFVAETSAGSDLFWITGAGVGQIVGAFTVAGKLTVTDQVAIAGDADEVQLTVTGHTTQTNAMAVFETKAGADVITFTVAGAADFASSAVKFGTDNLYALGYASDARALVCGTTDITGTATVSSGADTYTYATCSMGEAPAITAGTAYQAWCTINSGDLVLYAYTITATQATETNVAVNWCVVSDTQP